MVIRKNYNNANAQNKSNFYFGGKGKDEVGFNCGMSLKIL